MRSLDLTALIRATDGKIFSEVETDFTGIGTDTRLSLKGQLFIALKGESFDAHDFLSKAIEQGASALLVHRFPEELSPYRGKITIVVVKDTLQALHNLANYFRHQSKSTVIGITGSNGKTTSKEFTAAVIATQKKVHYSKGSFNNHWGVPFSLLQEPAQTEVTVIEMGMNHPGEITELCKIAQPDIVVCTVVGRAHIEHFGEIENIALAKEEIYDAAPPAARRIYNLDNPWTQRMFLRARERFPKANRLISFSQMNPKADVFFQIESMTMDAISFKGKILNTEGAVVVPVFGRHNLTNVMVAASCALAVGMRPEDIWPALIKCKTNWGRNQLVKTKAGAQILFDGYNSNPDSMNALLENVPILKAARKVAVFAEMLELGEFAAKAHREIGEKAANSNFDLIWFYGPHAKDFAEGAKSQGYAKALFTSNDYDDSIAKKIAAELKVNDIVLVKGSRGMKLEKFVVACDPLDFSMSKE